MEHLTTSQVAAYAGVNLDTVRYYEKRGLLPEPPRTTSGYRQYGMAHVTHLRFIKRAQELGFTLDEIKDLLDLRAEAGSGAEVRKKTAGKIAAIDAKIHDLQRIRNKLAELADACEQHGSPKSCLVLHALESPTEEPVPGYSKH